MNDSTATISKIWARTERLQRWRSATVSVSLSCYCSRSKKAARQQRANRKSETTIGIGDEEEMALVSKYRVSLVLRDYSVGW